MDKTAAKTVTIKGVRCTWNRAPKRSGRSGMGSGPNKFRPWYLESPEGKILVTISHTGDYPPFVSVSEPPAWKVQFRFPAKAADVERYGAYRDFTLKARIDSPEGDEDEASVLRAMNLAVSSYEKQLLLYLAK